MIVVTTPTGQIGQNVVNHLLAAGSPVRAIVRDVSKLPVQQSDQIELIEGSHGDPEVIDRALNGAEALFWLAPPDPRKTLEQAYLDFTRPAVGAIRRHGVKRVVSVTALGRGTAWQAKAGLVTASIAMDDLLMGSGAAFCGLASPSFMDNILRQAARIRDSGVFYGPSDPTRKAPTTATRDIGFIAAQLLADPTWTGQSERPVLGPENISFNDIAEIISEVTSREVRYQQITFDEFKAQLLQSGMSESFAQGYVDMMRAKDDGMDNLSKPEETIRTVTTFREWCEITLKPAILEGMRP